MNYYNEIKKELLDNEINKKAKDYSKNKYEIKKYYNAGKLLLESGNSYGDGIIICKQDNKYVIENPH